MQKHMQTQYDQESDSEEESEPPLYSSEPPTVDNIPK